MNRDSDDPTALERLLNVRRRVDSFLHTLPDKVTHAFVDLLHSVVDEAEEERGGGDSEQRTRVANNAPPPKGPPESPPKENE